MKCTCVSDIEKKVKEKLITSGQFKKPVKTVVMDGVTLAVSDSKCESRTVNYLEIELEGQKKLERIAMFHTYCPFCGVKQGEDA